MKWIRHNNKITSRNYEMKFIRFHIVMKEFIALLKNEILPGGSSTPCLSPADTTILMDELLNIETKRHKHFVFRALFFFTVHLG